MILPDLIATNIHPISHNAGLKASQNFQKYLLIPFGTMGVTKQLNILLQMWGKTDGNRGEGQFKKLCMYGTCATLMLR